MLEPKMVVQKSMSRKEHVINDIVWLVIIGFLILFWFKVYSCI